MGLIAKPITSSMLVFDTSWKLSLTEAKTIAELAPKDAAGAPLVAIGRYFFFGPPRAGDLDAAELEMYLGLGYVVFGIRHVPLDHWHADGPTGKSHAEAAVANAIRAGYVTPPGAAHPIAMTTDSEAVGNPGPAMDDYVRASFQVAAGRYQNVGYNGFDCGLRGVDLDALTADASCGGDTTEWWCDFAAIAQRPPPAKGYAWHQQAQTTLAGIGVDRDSVIRDGAIWGLAIAPDVVADPDDRAATGADLAAMR